MSEILTVLIPTYNSFDAFYMVLNAYIRDKRVKVIVSDDSDDKQQKKMIEEFCQKLNILYIEGPRVTAVTNWNSLLNNIETPFFVINHHDDFPTNLLFLNQLDSEKIGLTILPCSSKLINNQVHHMESWQQYIFSKICLMFPNSSFNMILAPTAAIIVNSKLKEILFDENLKWFVDAYWYMKLFLLLKKLKLKVKFLSSTKIISHQRKNSITNSLKQRINLQIKKEKKYLFERGFYPGHLINAIQFCFLALILLKTKLKQIFFNF